MRCSAPGAALRAAVSASRFKRPAEDALLHASTQQTLRAIFDRVVLTSPFIERQFAKCRRWCYNQTVAL